MDAITSDFNDILRKANEIPPKAKQMAPAPRAVEQLIIERHNTHGDYSVTARISQVLKDIIRQEPGWANLNDCQRESLDMNAVKTARILSGDPNTKDHWDDIAGYAKLVSERI